MMRVTSALLALAVALVSVTAVIPRIGESADADVTTMGATALRTSWYPNQSGLSPSLVGGGTFGQLFSANVVGQVYAQPLVSQGTLLVATEAGNVYGLDPASGAERWARNLHTPWNPADLGCGDLTPTIGITGTPTVDPATNTAYLLAKTYRSGTSGPAAWWAHAIDVATGAERPGFPVLIQGLAANDPTHVFNATNQMQRPGLLLMDGVVYAGFGGHCDFGPYEGWVVGISTAGRITTLWTTEAHQGGSPGAGIWQSGGGLVSDGPGRIFLSTGNGNATNRPTPGASPPDALGAAVVRLAVQPDDSLRASDFFAPYDAQHLNEWDADRRLRRTRRAPLGALRDRGSPEPHGPGGEAGLRVPARPRPPRRLRAGRERRRCRRLPDRPVRGGLVEAGGVAGRRRLRVRGHRLGRPQRERDVGIPPRVQVRGRRQRDAGTRSRRVERRRVRVLVRASGRHVRRHRVGHCAPLDRVVTRWLRQRRATARVRRGTRRRSVRAQVQRADRTSREVLQPGYRRQPGLRRDARRPPPRVRGPGRSAALGAGRHRGRACQKRFAEVRTRSGCATSTAIPIYCAGFVSSR